MSKKVICTPIGIIFRKSRLDMEESLFEMAQRLGMSSSRLSGIEYGRLLITKDETIRFLHEYCGASSRLKNKFLSIIGDIVYD